MSNRIEEIANEMVTQNNRHTAWPLFVVMEKVKTYPRDGGSEKERQDPDWIDIENDTCEDCREHYDKTGSLPDECDEFDCRDSFIGFDWEERPSMRAGFFFTAKACDEHIIQNSHHYSEGARSYAISAYHNDELQEVMKFIGSKANNGEYNPK